MKKAIIWWLFSIVVACAAIVGLIQYGDNDILNLILLLLLLLSLLGGGLKATVTTVKSKRSGQASEEKWLNEHHWEKMCLLNTKIGVCTSIIRQKRSPSFIATAEKASRIG